MGQHGVAEFSCVSHGKEYTRAGVFTIISPVFQVVILLVQHNSQGSVGLILNRPSGIKLGALPVSESGPSPLQISFRDNSLYLGGFDANQVRFSSLLLTKSHSAALLRSGPLPSFVWHQIPTGSGGHCRKFHPWRWRGTYAQLRPRFRTVSDDLMLAEPEPQGKNPFTDSKLHCGGYFHQQVLSWAEHTSWKQQQ